MNRQELLTEVLRAATEETGLDVNWDIPLPHYQGDATIEIGGTTVDLNELADEDQRRRREAQPDPLPPWPSWEHYVRRRAKLVQGWVARLEARRANGGRLLSKQREEA